MLKVGILGAGQLAQMLTLAGYNLNMRSSLYNFSGDASADIGKICDAQTGASLEEFIENVDFITYEFENLPIDAVEKINAKTRLYPNVKSLETAQHRGKEKALFTSLGLPVAQYTLARSAKDLQNFYASLNSACIIKTCRFGYDGKGQKVINAKGNFEKIWQEMGGSEFGELLIEQKIDFKRELSILAARNIKGDIEFYPLVQNIHREGILRYTLAPALNVTLELQKKAENYAQKILEHLDYVGVLALELFEVADELLVNEMAPRVHNSGHWSQDSDCTSQFENHLRAVANLPLGQTKPKNITLMINLIGEVPQLADVLEFKTAKLHLYGKTGRAGRKVGHINIQGNTHAEVINEAQKVVKKLDLPTFNFGI